MADLLPKSYDDFHTKAYWDSFFQKRKKEAFEWYGSFRYATTQKLILFLLTSKRALPLPPQVFEER